MTKRLFLYGCCKKHTFQPRYQETNYMYRRAFEAVKDRENDWHINYHPLFYRNKPKFKITKSWKQRIIIECKIQKSWPTHILTSCLNFCLPNALKENTISNDLHILNKLLNFTEKEKLDNNAILIPIKVDKPNQCTTYFQINTTQFDYR